MSTDPTAEAREFAAKREPRLSNSVARGHRCQNCGSRDVRGMPSPFPCKRYRSFGCAQCGRRWTEGHRGYCGDLSYLNNRGGTHAP